MIMTIPISRRYWMEEERIVRNIFSVFDDNENTISGTLDNKESILLESFFGNYKITLAIFFKKGVV